MTPSLFTDFNSVASEYNYSKERKVCKLSVNGMYKVVLIFVWLVFKGLIPGVGPLSYMIFQSLTPFCLAKFRIFFQSYIKEQWPEMLFYSFKSIHCGDLRHTYSFLPKICKDKV